MKESYPTVRALRDQGWSVARIARHLRKHPRTIDYILATGAKLPGGSTATITIEPDPKPVEELAPDVQALLEYTPDAFEAFFNRYSPWTLAAHSRTFVETALPEKAVLLNVPVRHAKSEIFSVWLPIWHICGAGAKEAGRGLRDVQILLLSKTRDQALKFTQEIVTHLEQNAELIKDFGRFKPDSNSAIWSPSMGKFMVAGRRRTSLSGDITLMARGAKMGVYGFAADLIVADDVVDDENSATPDRRDKLSRWFHAILESRLNPNAKKFAVGTRFHEDDLWGELSRRKRYRDGSPVWKHIDFPAVLNWSSEEVLWPEEWPFEALMEQRDAMGSSIFDQIYQQNPIPSDERTVQTEWIDTCWDRERAWGPRKAKGTRVMSLDPSPTRFAGLVVADVTGDRKNFMCEVLEVSRAKMDVRQMMGELSRISKAYRPSTLIIEVNAAQRWFLQDAEFEAWRRAEGIRVIPHTTSINKADAEMGVKSLGADFEFGRIRLPGIDKQSKDAMEPLIEEALSHPYGRTDDVLMALWFIKWNHQRLYSRKDRTSPKGRRFHVPNRLSGRPFSWLEKEPA